MPCRLSLVLGFVIPVGLLGAGCSNTQPVTINFRGQVGSQTFACGQSYANVGTTATEIQPADFRFYINNVRLVDSAGNEQPLTLDQDMLWQYQGVALLDFEDKTAPCQGTPQTNTQVHGQASPGSGAYTGLRFELGVPPALNHGNQAVAPPPLNLSDLFWSWEDGYKFLRTEGSAVSAAATFIFHLGSTGCVRNTATGETDCSSPNTAEVSLMGFNPLQNTVGADLAAIFSGSDMSMDLMCQSDPASADCGPVFQRLGVEWGGIAATSQSFFTVE